MSEPLNNIRADRLMPKSIHIRVLVPDSPVPLALSGRAEDLEGNPEFRERVVR